MIPRWVVLAAGLAVGLAGAALTATGLTAVALGSGVSPRLAWLYVASTDGLALTAYGATTVLGRRLYPWLIVLAAAGLSGLAQAAHLAQGGGGAAVVTWTWLRFGVGYWPAVSVAVCAHLVWLVAAGHESITIAAGPRGEPVERTYEGSGMVPTTGPSVAHESTDEPLDLNREPDGATGLEPSGEPSVSPEPEPAWPGSPPVGRALLPVVASPAHEPAVDSEPERVSEPAVLRSVSRRRPAQRKGRPPAHFVECPDGMCGMVSPATAKRHRNRKATEGAA